MDYCLITDRGGHLHNALCLVKQMGKGPTSIVTTPGPEIDSLKSSSNAQVETIVPLFTFVGKKRFLNPLRVIKQFFISFQMVRKLRPTNVVSLGATNVVFFCYWARLFGATIYHIECMNQVQSPSITGRMLYPICLDLYVQWPELQKKYGPKAKYAGWVL